MEMIFYGNELVQQTLRQMIQRNRTAHGFLFYGDPGLGKKTLARRTAAALLCSGAEKPCGVCGTCIDRAEAFRLNGVKDPALDR